MTPGTCPAEQAPSGRHSPVTVVGGTTPASQLPARFAAKEEKNMSVLCFIDTETTGLDPRIHQPYEVCWWREDEESPTTWWLPHTLEYADGAALRIGGYFDRDQHPWGQGDDAVRSDLLYALRGVTLVGSNPSFDAQMLRRFLGTEVWHHRLVNVSEGGMWVFGWDRPKGLAGVATECRNRGFEIPEPDHTAEGDVRATRAVYEALRTIRSDFPTPTPEEPTDARP